MKQQTMIITGASDGIGAEAARALSLQGHKMVLVGRNREKTAAIARELRADHYLADFSQLDEVRALASLLLQRYPQIDVLANNAGGIFTPARQSTDDGFELTLQVNYLAPYLLTHLLLDRLVASRAAVINTSSVANRLYGKVDLSDLNAERYYDPKRAYGNAKLEQIMFTSELQRRFGSQGLGAAAFHPGIVRTGFSRAPGSSMESIYANRFISAFLATPAKGADTLIWLAGQGRDRTWPSGAYFKHRKVARTNPQANDVSLCSSLWEQTRQMLQLT
ncbi:SDR family NAD(P)-dependent oxidoreductase [Paeniglutamicibacter antarcticus]|uniref:SDR family NAD(P)-dependent oxidoreductase n=1 Tax=Paeniglutamicibacter antarcticus TaxID=494023 RepID=A0ABP9TNP8_9MICC